MRSLREDRTARAIIRDEALRLFAKRGADAVTVRDIAAAAQVSPALVLRHYGSKDGLRQVVSGHALTTFEAALRAATPADGSVSFDPDDAVSLAEQIGKYLPADSPLPSYLARLLIDGGDHAQQLFDQLHAMSITAVERLVTAGLAVDGGDVATRAAFLLVNDLAVILLRGCIQTALGVDPLAGEGLQRWGRQVLAIYRGGLTAPVPSADPERP